jgi:hypothetical protein
VYVFHPGYWGPHVGYYGGINYGFGYAGVGFTGGRWAGNAFAYNRSVNNLDSRIIHNTYSETPAGNTVVTKVSYNGGPGGITAVPTAQERAAASEPHIPATPLQHRYVQQPAAQRAAPPVAPRAPPPVASRAPPPVAPRVARPAAPARTAANETSEPAPREKLVAARPAAPRSGTAGPTSSQHPTH